MKLTKLTKRDLAVIACATADAGLGDDTDSKLVDQIGSMLKINAVAGEGYDTTVWRVCRIIIDFDPPSAESRISEMLSVIGIEGIAQPINDARMLATTLAAMDSYDAKMAAESIKAILKQHKKFAPKTDN